MIYINIWDDYWDDQEEDKYPKRLQETYAYVERNYPDEINKAILELLQENIKNIIKVENNLEFNLEYYDSSKIYPEFIGTKNESFLYKRWQLNIKNLTHELREYIVNYFKLNPLNYLGKPIILYSES